MPAASRLLSLAALSGVALAALPTVRVQVPTSAPPNATYTIDDNFIGISFELSSFDTLWGRTPNKIPVPMQNYLHNMVARLSKPLRIRVGGNGMDGSTYHRSYKDSMLELPDPDAYFNDIPANFGPVLFDVMNAMTRLYQHRRAWSGCGEGAGDRLDSMLLGNEPDLYAGHGERDAYEISDYIPELGNAIQALTEGGALTEGAPKIGGPTTCCGWTLKDVLDAGMDKLPYNYYTLQRYPNHACSGVNEKNTNLTQYQTHLNVEPYLSWNAAGMERARELGVPVIMTEYNSVSCGGTYISETFTMSLWAVDVGLKAATMGYTAVYLHTREHGIQYNLFDPVTPETSLDFGWRTGSPYYAALFLAEVTSPDGNIVVDLDIGNSTTDPDAKVAGYALYSAKDRTQEKLVFFNWDETDTQPFRIPANLTNKIEYRILTAASLTETTDIKWAGQTIGDHGNLDGEQETTEIFCQDGCIVNVPGPGAALVILNPNVTLFSGNSTLTGYLASDSGALRSVQMAAWASMGAIVLAPDPLAEAMSGVAPRRSRCLYFQGTERTLEREGVCLDSDVGGGLYPTPRAAKQKSTWKRPLHSAISSSRCFLPKKVTRSLHNLLAKARHPDAIYAFANSLSKCRMASEELLETGYKRKSPFLGFASIPSDNKEKKTASDISVDVHSTDAESIKFVDDSNVENRRQIGLVSAIFIIFNRIIGTGVFATPSSILGFSGSVGLSLFMWIIGAVIAAAGMQVYIVWGTAVPKNGGEKNYLEYLFRKPRFLVTSMFAANGVLLAWAAGNSLVFGEYILRAANVEPTRWTLRLVGFACITFSLLVHGTAVKWGLRLQNFLGVLKLIVLVFIIITGFVALGGHMKIEKPHNFTNAFEGTTASASSFCSRKLCLTSGYP
ncbi:hypothetical protein NMY22_g5656 [Coprinellus aureogranulatus]|nr:hypothetical protein NMY22_g5656 [Coprinellus aureogranulatus]